MSTKKAFVTECDRDLNVDPSLCDYLNFCLHPQLSRELKKKISFEVDRCVNTSEMLEPLIKQKLHNLYFICSYFCL